jgi:hypothetical protein
MSNGDKILSLIRQKGPSLPSGIYRELETNQLFASAMLGEMVSNGSLQVTHLKRGTSPYYYLEEQKDRLQEFSKYLNDKDIIAYNFLKNKLILKDSEQSPLIRVALRAIKDYAVPIQIKYKEQSQLFWKWYLLPNSEAEEKIKIFLGVIKDSEKLEEKQLIKKAVDEKPIETKKIENKQEKKLEIKKKEAVQKKIIKKKEVSSEIKGGFIDQLTKYFKKNNITIVSQEAANTKKTEIDFILEVPSAFGNLQYYCKAKNKKKINDSDIASAFVQGQQKKLPVIVLITGEMTKKSKEMLDNEFKGIKVHNI